MKSHRLESAKNELQTTFSNGRLKVRIIKRHMNGTAEFNGQGFDNPGCLMTGLNFKAQKCPYPKVYR